LVHGKSITEVYTATMKPDKLVSLRRCGRDGPSFRNSCAAQTEVKDDCNLVKPKIRSSGSFKKQNTQLALCYRKVALLCEKNPKSHNFEKLLATK